MPPPSLQLVYAVVSELASKSPQTAKELRGVLAHKNAVFTNIRTKHVNAILYDLSKQRGLIAPVVEQTGERRGSAPLWRRV